MTSTAVDPLTTQPARAANRAVDVLLPSRVVARLDECQRVKKALSGHDFRRRYTVDANPAVQASALA